MLSTSLCAAVSPWRQGSRLCFSPTRPGEGWALRDAGGFCQAISSPPRETRDPLPVQPLLCPGLWETHLPSSPGHCFWGPGVSGGFGGLSNSAGHSSEPLGWIWGYGPGLSSSPAPGHVYPVEVEESVSMMRADSGHWARDKDPASQACGREAGGKAPPTPLPSLHHGDHDMG